MIENSITINFFPGFCGKVGNFRPNNIIVYLLLYRFNILFLANEIKFPVLLSKFAELNIRELIEMFEQFELFSTT